MEKCKTCLARADMQKRNLRLASELHLLRKSPFVFRFPVIPWSRSAVHLCETAEKVMKRAVFQRKKCYFCSVKKREEYS